MTELDRLGWVVEESYALGGWGFGVRTTSKEFGEWLDHALGAYRAETTSIPHYSIVVGGAESGGLVKERYHALYKGTIAIAKTLDLMALVRTFFSDLEQYLWAEREDAIFADMVPVALDGVTALVPWDLVPFIGTLGKRRTERYGIRFPVETSVAVEPGGRVIPTPKLVEPAEGSLESLAQAFPMSGADNRMMVDEPIDVDLVVSVGAAEEPLVPVSRGVALYRLAAHVGNIEIMGASAVEGLCPLVERARCFELGIGKPAVKLEALVRALKSG